MEMTWGKIKTEQKVSKIKAGTRFYTSKPFLTTSFSGEEKGDKTADGTPKRGNKGGTEDNKMEKNCFDQNWAQCSRSAQPTAEVTTRQIVQLSQWIVDFLIDCSNLPVDRQSKLPLAADSSFKLPVNLQFE